MAGRRSLIRDQEAVRALLASPTSLTGGEAFMRGQMLEPKVVILQTWRETP